MTSPRASIVVTNYDYERYVGAAIESALDQHGGPVQVIVVDDGSNDASLDVIAGYDDITVIAQTNGGQGAAFNAGFALARAPIVFFLDADDLLAPDVVDRVVAAFADSSVVRVQFRLDLVDSAGRRLPGEMPPVGTTLADGDVRSRLVRFPDDLVWQPTSGNAFRADVLRRILPMPTDAYEICADYYLSNLSPVHGTVAVLDDIGGSYRVHASNRDFAQTIGLDAIRKNIVRTSETHRHLIEECRGVGLAGLPDDPDAVRSVTALAMRMISLRLDSGSHPVSGDSRFGLVRRGIRAALGRDDISVMKRGAIAGWFASIGSSPHRAVPFLARRFVPLDIDARSDGVG